MDLGLDIPKLQPGAPIISRIIYWRTNGEGCTVIEHPLAQQALAEMRHRDTSVENFRRALGQLGLLLLAEATRNLPVKSMRVRTPLAMAPASAPARPIALVPILRAGQGMVSLADHLLPQAVHAHLGMARNEDTLQPECYLEKLPPRLGRYEVIVCDPMLATAGSAIAAGQLFTPTRRPPLYVSSMRWLHRKASALCAKRFSSTHFHGVDRRAPQ